MATKVAVVTGSNKGIGFAIVRGLCKQFQGDIYLTARDEGRGKEAVKLLESEGLKPLFHQLDINDRSSIERLATFLKERYGGLDILVNNAGMAFKGSSTAPFSEQAEVSLATNYWGTLDCCNVLFPLLRPGARVCHVSSGMTMFAYGKSSPDLQAEFRAINSLDQVSDYMRRFVSEVKAGNHKAKGWPDTAYGVSKLGVSLMTPFQQAAFDKDAREDIVVNSICPGYVDTDMTSGKGSKTIDEGAVDPLYVSMLPPKTDVRGSFVRDKKIVTWLS